MQGDKLDVLSSKETQLKILIPYLETLAKDEKIQEEDLPLTIASFTLISRYMRGWEDLYISGRGLIPQLSPEGTFKYYLLLISGGWK